MLFAVTTAAFGLLEFRMYFRWFTVLYLWGIVMVVLSMARMRDAGRSFVWGFIALPVIVVPSFLAPYELNSTLPLSYPLSGVIICMLPAIVIGLFRSSPGQGGGHG